MASEAQPVTSFQQTELSTELASQWRRLTRVATAVGLITAPAVVVWLNQTQGWAWYWSILAALLVVVCFRGIIDLVFHRMIPRPSLFGLESQQLREEDVVARRRVWFWRFWVKVAIVAVVIGGLFYFLGLSGSLIGILPLLVIFPVYMIFNFVILFGPLLMMNLSQIQAFEPGDAEWGVKLADVRGQIEAKEEVRRFVSIWQSGEAFDRAGGKRERGLLFLGAPGTGKTMLAKALATGFNSPFVSIPGSGFAATFIGIDAIVVRVLARRAKRLARKWGGQCIVFIDEIDAVGMRRQALDPGFGGASGHRPIDLHELLFYGPNGALNPSGDLILETRQWRERLFAERAPSSPGPSGFTTRVNGVVDFMFPGGMGGGGGSLALNQLLVVMDGIDNPPFLKKFFTNKVNTLLDGIYIVPRRIGKRSLRIPGARPRREQIYFIGATNVPVDRLDPALTRPGRLGRHVWFRTPTKQDRLDILDLYIGKVAHDPELDQAHRREEIAPLRVQLPAGPGREPGHGAHPCLELSARSKSASANLDRGSPLKASASRPLPRSKAHPLRDALARAKTRLDRLDYYPTPVQTKRVRIVVAPWFFRIPGFRRYSGYAFWRTILLQHHDASDDLVTHELCHIWQGQHQPVRMAFKHMTTRYHRNPYELEARRAVSETRPM